MRVIQNNESIVTVKREISKGATMLKWAGALTAATTAIRFLLVSAGARFRVWQQLRASRRALNKLTDKELRDIGIGRNQAREEYRKSLFID